MAIVRHLERRELNEGAVHTETECSYSVVLDDLGGRYLQIDTYGSAERKMTGKKSQSIRFSMEAIRELRKVISQDFPT